MALGKDAEKNPKISMCRGNCIRIKYQIFAVIVVVIWNQIVSQIKCKSRKSTRTLRRSNHNYFQWYIWMIAIQSFSLFFHPLLIICITKLTLACKHFNIVAISNSAFHKSISQQKLFNQIRSYFEMKLKTGGKM